MFSAITISLVPEARGGPFVFWDDIDTACQQAASIGFDAVEIFPRSADEIDAPRLKKTLQQYDLKLAGMGTGAGWVVHKLRLTDPDPKIRQQATDFAARIVTLAGEFGAPAIVGSMQGRWEGDVGRDQALNWLAEALEPLALRAQALGVPLMFEPLNRYETNLLNRVVDTLAFLNGLRSSNLRLLCDLFHMNIEESNLAEALRLAGSRLGHVHFADSNRQAIGFGHIDVTPVAQALRDIGFGGFISAEVLPLPDSQAAAFQTMKSFQCFFAPA